MDISSVNWLAVLACVVVSMIVGSLWFNDKTFFPVWWKAIGKTKKDIPGMTGTAAMVKTFGLTILASFILAVFMALMINAMGTMLPNGATLGSGAMAGLIIWLGFVAPTSLTNRVFAGQLKAWTLEVGNHLITLILFGAILGVWH